LNKYQIAIKLLNDIILFKNLFTKKEIESFRYSLITLESLNKNYDKAFENIKPLLYDNPDSNEIWLIYNYITSKISNFQSQKKILESMLIRSPNNINVMLLVGNYSLFTRNYRYSLGEYFRAFKLKNNDPLILLLIAITYLSLASMRTNLYKSYTIIQALTFFSLYRQKNLAEDETNFNLGKHFKIINTKY
jgi:tetratricopeptide (TPR) repeat protein